MPEEAIDFADKQEIYYRRFQKRLRDRLKALITPELIEEHRQRPLGQRRRQVAQGRRCAGKSEHG